MDNNLHITIDLAKYRCKNEPQLIDELTSEPIMFFNDKPNLILSLSEIDISKEGVERITNYVDKVIKEGEKIESRYKYKVDSLLKKLVNLLPSEKKIQHAMNFLKHKRKNRRSIGHSILKGIQCENQYVKDYLDLYKIYSDEEFLKVLARNIDNIDLTKEQVIFIVNELEEDYWKCRVLEGCITEPIENYIVQLIKKYPIASIRLMGRSKNKLVKSIIENTFEDYFDDIDTLGLLFWALGQIRDLETINKLEKKIIGDVQK